MHIIIIIIVIEGCWSTHKYTNVDKYKYSSSTYYRVFGVHAIWKLGLERISMLYFILVLPVQTEMFYFEFMWTGKWRNEETSPLVVLVSYPQEDIKRAHDGLADWKLLERTSTSEAIRWVCFEFMLKKISIVRLEYVTCLLAYVLLSNGQITICFDFIYWKITHFYPIVTGFRLYRRSLLTTSVERRPLTGGRTGLIGQVCQEAAACHG